MLAYNYWASSCGRMRILWYVHIWIDFGVTYHCNKNLEHFVLAIVKYYTDRFPSCHKPIMISFYAWVIPNCTKRSFGQKRFQPRVAFGAYMCTSPDGSTRFVLKGNNPPISSNLAVVKVELGEVVCIDYERDCINQTDTFHGSQDIEVLRIQSCSWQHRESFAQVPWVLSVRILLGVWKLVYATCYVGVLQH